MNNKELDQINDNDLQLVVKEQEMGKLVTNALQIKEVIINALPRYDVSNYSSDNVAKAKEDKALLNKAAKTLNDKRIELEKLWMKPFDDFKNIVKDTCSLIKDCTSRIDGVVKDVEEKEKEEKNIKIEELFNSVNSDESITLKMIFSDKWLNKSVSLKHIETEMQESINSIKSDVQTLKKLYPVDEAAVLETYYATLSLNEAIEYGHKVVERRESAQKIVIPEASNENIKEQPKEIIENSSSDADDAFADALGETINVIEKKNITVNLKLILTEEELKEVENFLWLKNINYKKI